MLTESQERLLMERTAEGDRSAFRQLFDNYYPVVFGFMKSLLQVKEDASDVAQEVFIKLWLMRSALPDITSLRFYLYRMSLNQTINFIKKNKSNVRSILTDIPYDQMVEDAIDMKDKEAFIAAVVSRMPEQRRKIFIMSRLEHRTNDEIATLLHIKKKTVENHLNLASRNSAPPSRPRSSYSSPFFSSHPRPSASGVIFMNIFVANSPVIQSL